MSKTSWWEIIRLSNQFCSTTSINNLGFLSNIGVFRIIKDGFWIIEKFIFMQNIEYI